MYELVDSCGKTTMELGRFVSDEAAVKATLNVIPPPGSKLLVVRGPEGRRSVVEVEFVKSKSKKQLLADLLSACKRSSDKNVAALARAYET